MDDIRQHREFLKSAFSLSSAEGPSDQQKGLPYPPLEKPSRPQAKPIDLLKVDRSVIQKDNIFDCIFDRCSRREFSDQPLSVTQLSFLLWATQGVKKVLGKGYASLRMVPSAGARHPFETYLIIHRVEGLDTGIYRYLPLTHQLLLISSPQRLAECAAEAGGGQSFLGDCAAVFVWACMPYRAEWRYRQRAHKLALLDVGHIGQNLYLACEAIGCGTCAVAAYDQLAFDRLLGLDGQDEMTVYLATIGNI